MLTATQRFFGFLSETHVLHPAKFTTPTAGSFTTPGKALSAIGFNWHVNLLLVDELCFTISSSMLQVYRLLSKDNFASMTWVSIYEQHAEKTEIIAQGGMDCIIHLFRILWGFFSMLQQSNFCHWIYWLYSCQKPSFFTLCQDLAAAFVCFPTHDELLTEWTRVPWRDPQIRAALARVCSWE